MSACRLHPRLCSLIPGLGVKLSTIILAGPTVLSAVGACPPHDGVRRRWRTNVASAVVLLDARKKSDDLTTATVPAGTTFPAVSLGELGPPSLQSRPFRHAGQQHAGCLKQIHAQHGVTALRDSAGPIDFPRGMASSRQSDIGPDTSRSLEARRIVDCRLEAECGDWADTRYGHKPTDLHIMTRQLVNLTVEIVDLLLDGLARLKQRPHCSNELGTILDQLCGSHSKDIELATADDQTEVLKKATDLVLEIALDLDQQRPARQQCLDRVAVEVLDAYLLEPAA